MWLLSVGTASHLTPVCPQHQPRWASLPLVCPVADPVVPQPRVLPGSGREEWQLVGANVSPCSSSTGEVPPVLARRALCPVPVFRGGPHGRVQHATVHPPGVQGDGCQGECSCWLPRSPASRPLPCPGQQRERATAPGGTRKQGAALHCRQKGLLPATCCSSHHKLCLAQPQ